jgi:hypothetical protein
MIGVATVGNSAGMIDGREILEVGRSKVLDGRMAADDCTLALEATMATTLRSGWQGDGGKRAPTTKTLASAEAVSGSALLRRTEALASAEAHALDDEQRRWRVLKKLLRQSAVRRSG